MEFEFDKEMDAILRRGAAGEALALPGSHPDADEITAFAENAVSDAARARYTAHFADCARCRKILSNVIVFNAEADAEAASSAVSVETAKSAVPWYRRFFAFPQAAYAMGAMVLLFSGFFGYLIIRNLPGANSSEVSYSTNRSAPAIQSAPPDSSVSTTSNANTATNSAATTTATNSSNTALPSTTTANGAPLPSSNTTAASATPSREITALPEPAAPVTQSQPMTATPEAKPETKDADDDRNLLKSAPAAKPNDQSNAAGAAMPQSQRSRDDAELKEDRKNDLLSLEKSKNRRIAEEDAPKKQISRAGEQRSVGGKTFNNVGGIWFDAAYSKQKTRNVRRGTGDYRKLDPGLRAIADSLGGTVVVVWNGRVYRIQ